MKRVRTSLYRCRLLFCLVLIASGCGGDGVNPTGGMMGGGTVPTLAEIQQSVFTPRCAVSGCHAGPTPPQGLNLEEGLARSNLVNVSSNELPAFLRVNPANAADSYLFMKVSGDSRILFDQMPLGGPALSGDDLLTIAEWIDAGAP